MTKWLSRAVWISIVVILALLAYWGTDRTPPIEMTQEFVRWSDDGNQALMLYKGEKKRVCHGTSVGGVLIGTGREAEHRDYVEVSLLPSFNRTLGTFDVMLWITVPRFPEGTADVRATFDMDFICNVTHVAWPIEVNLASVALPLETRPAAPP